MVTFGIAFYMRILVFCLVLHHYFDRSALEEPTKGGWVIYACFWYLHKYRFPRWLLKRFSLQIIHQWSKMKCLPTDWVSFQSMQTQGYLIICQVKLKYISVILFDALFHDKKKEEKIHTPYLFLLLISLSVLKCWFHLFYFHVDNDTPNEKNTIVFKLHVRCERGSPRLTGIVIMLFVNSVV